MLLQQLVIYALIGLIMDHAGYAWDSAIYWCMLTLVVLSNYLARREGVEQGLDMAEATLTAANKLLDIARAEHDRTQAMLATDKEQLGKMWTEINKGPKP